MYCYLIDYTWVANYMPGPTHGLLILLLPMYLITKYVHQISKPLIYDCNIIFIFGKYPRLYMNSAFLARFMIDIMNCFHSG